MFSIVVLYYELTVLLLNTTDMLFLLFDSIMKAFYLSVTMFFSSVYEETKDTFQTMPFVLSDTAGRGGENYKAIVSSERKRNCTAGGTVDVTAG